MLMGSEKGLAKGVVQARSRDLIWEHLGQEDLLLLAPVDAGWPSLPVRAGLDLKNRVGMVKVSCDSLILYENKLTNIVDAQT